MEIILIRHGEASASWERSTDPGLSDLGKNQAEECANILLKIKNIESFELISSPLSRAKETGEALSKKLNNKIIINPLFAEIPSPGINLQDRKTWLQDIFSKNLIDLETPQKKWYQKIISELKEIKKPSIVFSHFMVINIIVSHLTNNKEIVSFYPDNCSITKIEKENGEIKLINLGSQLQTIVN